MSIQTSIAMPLRVAVLVVAMFSVAVAQAQTRHDKFDPGRDAAKDVAGAIALAKTQGKRVMVDIGGEWCPWCHIMDRFIDANADVTSLVDAHYALLSRWPKVAGYPHLFVLDADGKLLRSQDTSALEAGKSYDKAKFVAFLQKWAGDRTQRPKA